MGKFLSVTILAVLLLSSCGDSLGEKYVGFAKCLAEREAVFYGAYWCPHCVNQKAMFGKVAEEFLPYVECDPRGKGGDPKLCLEKKIEGYPTWDFVGEERLSGEVALSVLAEKTGCELPANNTNSSGAGEA